MRVYIPNYLTAKIEEIVQAHPLTADAPQRISDTALKELVLRIDKKEYAALEMFSELLSNREVNSLCYYLKNNVHRGELKKVTTIIYYRMTQSYFQLVFEMWQQAPGCAEILQLLGDTEINYMPDQFQIERGYLTAWSNSSKPLDALAQFTRERGQGQNLSEKVAKMGIRAESLLGLECRRRCLVHGKLEEFIAEGDERIRGILEASTNEQKTTVILRLLYCAKQDIVQLFDFKKVHTMAKVRWGEPNSGRFPDGHPEEFAVYRHWCNYLLVYTAFRADADPQRFLFWREYLHLCSCSRYGKHGMIIMDFDGYVATEFEGRAAGPVYIMSAQKFEMKIQQSLRYYNTTELKSHLNQSSIHDRAFTRIEHRGSWQSKVRADLRMRKII